jgi:hypothetical protein
LDLFKQPYITAFAVIIFFCFELISKERGFKSKYEADKVVKAFLAVL